MNLPATERHVVVLGAGAAGLMAGIRAARCGADTLVLEKNARPGVKILMSGGTRCNITHDCDNRGIIDAYGPAGQFLHSALAAFSVQDTLDFFHAGGVPTKVEGPGKVFPVSDRATDVLGALLDALRDSGAELALSEPASGVSRRDDGRFDVTTPLRTVTARAVIVTTGGLSYPGSGTTGDGYAVARQFGHAIVPTRPALTPITSPATWVAGLRGITLPDVTLTLAGATPKPATRRGSLLFAHFGLTGPVALDLSRFISGHDAPASLALAADLAPDSTTEQLDAWLQQQSLDAGRKLLANVLAERLPHRLAEVALGQAGLAVDRRAAGLAKADRRRVVELLKRLPIPVSGTLGFGKAEVTAGGVDLREVRSKSLESKLAAGLYFAGEVLDLDGPIGGYNFQAAWSTGWLAGQSAASRT